MLLVVRGSPVGISQSECHIVRSVFHGNIAKAGGDGGAVYIDSKSSLKIENTDFTNNNGTVGGAIHIEDATEQFNNPEYVFSNNTFFLRNVALGDGTDVIIDNITCVGNRGLQGGCLNIDSVTLTLNNSEISENVADRYGVRCLGYRFKNTGWFPLPTNMPHTVNLKYVCNKVQLRLH